MRNTMLCDEEFLDQEMQESVNQEDIPFSEDWLKDHPEYLKFGTANSEDFSFMIFDKKTLLEASRHRDRTETDVDIPYGTDPVVSDVSAVFDEGTCTSE